jgi:ankyrin repeat protein
MFTPHLKFTDACDPYGRTLLHNAIRFANKNKGDTTAIKNLLRSNKCNDFLFHADYEGKMALHLAAEHGYYDIVVLLIEHMRAADQSKGSIAATDQHTMTALHLAAQNGHDDIVQFMIESKHFTLEEKDELNNTALHLAAQNWHPNTVLILLKHIFVDITENVFYPNDPDSLQGNTALHLAIKGKHTDIVKILLENNANPNLFDEFQHNALHLAIEHGLLDIVQLLLMREDKDQLMRPLIDCNSPLHLAARNGHPKIVSFFLKRGLDPNTTDNASGTTVLHEAVQHAVHLSDDDPKGLETVKVLLERGADPTQMNRKGKMPIDSIPLDSKKHINLLSLLAYYTLKQLKHPLQPCFRSTCFGFTVDPKVLQAARHMIKQTNEPSNKVERLPKHLRLKDAGKAREACQTAKIAKTKAKEIVALLNNSARGDISKSKKALLKWIIDHFSPDATSTLQAYDAEEALSILYEKEHTFYPDILNDDLFWLAPKHSGAELLKRAMEAFGDKHELAVKCFGRPSSRPARTASAFLVDSDLEKLIQNVARHATEKAARQADAADAAAAAQYAATKPAAKTFFAKQFTDGCLQINKLSPLPFDMNPAISVAAERPPEQKEIDDHDWEIVTRRGQ